MIYTHVTKVVEAKQINNANTAYRVVCCGESCDPSRCTASAHTCEDTWHTIGVSAPDPTEQLAAIKADVATRHDLMVQWRSNLAALLAAG
jgi:hypothetical protein